MSHYGFPESEDCETCGKHTLSEDEPIYQPLKCQSSLDVPIFLYDLEEKAPVVKPVYPPAPPPPVALV